MEHNKTVDVKVKCHTSTREDSSVLKGMMRKGQVECGEKFMKALKEHFKFI